MSEQHFMINNLDCQCSVDRASGRIVYVLYPIDTLGLWVKEASAHYGASVVVITGMDWQNDLTPWPAKGVPAGTPDFEGDAREFLKTLEATAIETEHRLHLPASVSRSLVGVSLSGLFALWQWTQTDFFHDIACMSGSFWYAGFTPWFVAQDMSAKTGHVYFLLGDKETHAGVKAYRSVGINTQQIVDRLKSEGASVQYDTVPGNHMDHPLERLDQAMRALALNSSM